MPLRIANGAGFLGDSLAAPRRLVESAEVDYLTLEYLAELTMSILARQREKDPQRGYAQDFLDVLRDLLPALRMQPQLKIVTNGGGMNPIGCAQQAARLLVEAGLADTPLGVVTGDDLLPDAAQLVAERNLLDANTGAPADDLDPAALVSANAYLGAEPIAQALTNGARIVITGRVADASLTVGPAMHAFSTPWNDWDRLAGYSVAGHLIECGAQVTGGYTTDWARYDLAEIGYPIAELEADGTCVITKPNASGGAVNRRTVIEQLTYEIGDPRHYLTPDVDVDFTAVSVEEIGPDRVRVFGARGAPAPEHYKVSAAMRDGYMASGELVVFGDDATAKARACARLVGERAGVDVHAELLGTGASVPGQQQLDHNVREVVLRMTAAGDRAAVERFAREIAPLITSGPAGLAGYAAGRPPARPVFRYRPLLIARSLVCPQATVRPARDWAN